MLTKMEVGRTCGASTKPKMDQKSDQTTWAGPQGKRKRGSPMAKWEDELKT